MRRDAATMTCQAHYYLDDSGSECTRQQFLEAYAYELFGACGRGEKGFMLFAGSDPVKLRIAVLAWDESSACEIFEDWARKVGREAEIGEDLDPEDPGWGEYECFVQQIPEPVVVMPHEVKQNAEL